MGFDWKGVIRTVAPTLATTLTGGNPLAGMAINAISTKLLGKPDGTEQEIMELMTGATPETLAQLKEVENDFKLKMKELGVEVHKIDADDRADARGKAERTNDATPAILAGVFIFSYILFVIAIMWKGVPQEAGTKEVVLILTGILGAAITQILNYYFGSSKGSADKTKMLGKR